MKVRSGFVSNSSSSSFILAYDRSKVTTNPKDIIELVKKENSNIILKGWDLGEGDDIFEISEEQASLIRKFPKEFIKMNIGVVKKDKYSFNEEKEEYEKQGEVDVPKITAYPGATLVFDKYEYANPEVDMSDFGPEPSFDIRNYIPPEKRTPEQAKQYEYENAWYREQEKRVQKARKEYRAEAIKEAKENLVKCGVLPENAEAEFVAVSNRSCDEDFFDREEFAYRYFTSEEDFDEQDLFKISKAKLSGYAIIYSEVYQDKELIIEMIEKHPEYSYGIGRCNSILNTLRDVENINIYGIGLEERELLLKNKKDFIESSKAYVLFRNPKLLRSGDDFIADGSKILIGYGYIYFGNPGENLPDFKKEIIKGKLSNSYLKKRDNDY